MPIADIFVEAALEDAGGAALTDAALTDAGASALGAESLGAAGITDAAMLGGEYAGGLGATGAGITGAGNVAAGGIGAGAGTNAAVAAQQGFSGIAPMADTGAYYEAGSGVAGPMAPDLQMAHANLDAANAAGGSGIGSALKEGWNAFKELPGPVQFLGGMAAINALGLNRQNAQFNNQPYSGPLNKYHLSPNFRGITANPQNYQYAPRYAAGGIMSAAGGGPVEQMSNNAAIGANTNYPMSNMTTSAFATPYQSPQSTNMIAPSGGVAVDQNTGELNPQGTRFAAGGIAHFARGSLAESLDYYDSMMEGPARQQMAAMQTPTNPSHDVGIVRDTDPDTMYLDPVSAAQVRMAKINKRANMQTPSMKRPTPMGTINLKPQGGAAPQQQQFQSEDMAQGGILQASGHLGGYAAGGQPRLLKGPGDGMSDDIPATIANKQPARLADGEFVVPADVVSHLGNGSTEAGAKKLHGMMDSVRKARTGRKAQGKQIDPNRFMPK